ncbi:MAG: fibronectin type III domain-containing protein, partial [Gammaproteobacteria bacterium]|nr:fibronectin type III domain-containing protein [Gammaproteobacteria bacterium]
MKITKTMKTSILSLSALSTNALSTNLFGRIKSATPLTRLVTLILTTLLLAACGGGGGGGGSSSPSVKEPALKTILDSSIDGIVLRWTNPDDVRNITITRSVYANSTAATPVSTPVSESHNNMTSKPELVAAGSITINVTGLPANKYYSFNITRGFDNNITDTIVSSRQYLSPDFVGNVTAALTTTGSGTSTELSLSWINPANVAGIASVRIIRNEFINSTVTEPLSTTMVRTGNIVGTATASDPSVPTNINVNITGLSINRYYTFTVTQIYTGNVEGPTSDPSARQYLPPAIVGTVTATLGEGGISVLLSWINPRNVAGIAAVRITRNEFANSTSSVSTATIYAPDFTDADAIASTNAGRTAATLNITSGLRADRYYTFSVAPIYTDITGDLVGPASSVSKLVGPLSSSLGDLEASLGATRAAGSATLTFNNPANVASITWTATAYNAATGGSVIRDLAPAQAYSGTINTQPEGASIPITGLATNQYYAFTIVRNLKPDSGGNTPPAITSDVSNRLYLPPTASGVTANLNTAKTGLILSWTNPQNFPGITAVRVIRQVYTSESGVAGVPVSTMITDASALAAGSVSIDIPGLPTDRYYSFTIAPIYDGGAGNADILAPTSAPSARQYIPPVTLNNVATTLNSDKTSVVLSWTNPRNAAGIKAVRIIRNEYADATTTDALSTEPTMITEVADSVNLDIPGLNPNSYYEFTVTPIYNAGARAAIPNADIEGLVSTPSARQYIPPATTATNVVTTLNSGGTSVLLSWTNPQSASGIKAVRITRREFADATTDVSTTTIDTPDYSVGSAVATNASLDLANGLSPNSYYSFTVTPIYNAGAKAATPGADILGFPTAPSARQYIPPAIGGVTATLSERNILAVLSWTNPQNVAGITAVRITIHEYADASAEDPIMVMDTSAYTDATAIATDASLDITSELNPDSYYEFTVTPLYNSGTVGADIVGPASALSTRVGPIGASADFATLTAMLNTDRDGIALSYNNPDSVRSITVTPTSYDSATATTGVLGTATTYSSQNTSPISFTEGKRVLALTGLVTNKYYTFTITRHLVSGGAINSAASTRQYLPPTAIDVVTSPTRPNGNVVILSWRNPQNLAGIKAVRIAWNEYANVTTNVVLGTNTADYTDATAIATSTTAAAEASLDVSSTLNPNRYYTFTVTPIYNGGAGNADIVGPRSAPSFRRYFPPAIVGDVTATLSSSNAGVTLSWTNAPNIGMEGVGVIYREYVDATATEPLAVSAYQFAKAASVRAENATINLPMDIISPSQAAPINLDSYYTFSVTPIYNGDGK